MLNAIEPSRPRLASRSAKLVVYRSPHLIPVQQQGTKSALALLTYYPSGNPASCEDGAHLVSAEMLWSAKIPSAWPFFKERPHSPSHSTVSPTMCLATGRQAQSSLRVDP